MKDNRGFTLIEVLSIIIVLAIISVITVPVILNTLDNSKKGVAMDSAYGYVNAVNKIYYDNSLNENDDIDDGIYSVSELKTMGVSINGKEPTDGWCELVNGDVVSYSLKFGDYVVTKYSGSDAVCEKGDVQEDEATRAARLKLEVQTQAATIVSNYISSLLADSTIQGYTEDTSKKVSEITTPAVPTGIDTNSWVYFEKGISSVTASDYSIKITIGDYIFVVNCVDGVVSSPVENGEITNQIMSVSFANDSWETIKANLALNRNYYRIGSEKIVNMNLEGTAKDYKLRLSNTESCSNDWQGSKTACGVVIEFVTTIGNHKMNESNTNAGGWYSSGMRSYLNSGNDSIYSKLNAVIGKDSSNNDIIISTTPVISGSGYDQTSPDSEDYLYLLSTREVGFSQISDNKNAATDTNILSYY